jgi:peptidyl-prolyl cis-trans isomerase NIMA-interacting 1
MRRMRVVLLVTLLLSSSVSACDKPADKPAADAAPAPSATSATPSASTSAAPAASASASAAATAADASTAKTADDPDGGPTEVYVQHVLISYKGAARVGRHVQRTKEEAKTFAAEIEKKAKAGEDFSFLAETYSDDPDAKGRRGSMGRIVRTDVVKPFADAAFKLKVHEISGVVETRFGFHIIKRNQ